MRAIRTLPCGYNRFSCCMTSLDMSTARLRDSWDVRQAAQNRSFTRPANDSGDWCKENKVAGKPVSLAPKTEVRPARKLDRTATDVLCRALFPLITSNYESSSFRLGSTGLER